MSPGTCGGTTWWGSSGRRSSSSPVSSSSSRQPSPSGTSAGEQVRTFAFARISQKNWVRVWLKRVISEQNQLKVKSFFSFREWKQIRVVSRATARPVLHWTRQKVSVARET